MDLPVAAAVNLISRAIREQQCVLFLGAGVHAPPPDGSLFEYPEERRPPSATKLSEMLAAEACVTDAYPDADPTNLQRVSLFFELTQGRGNLNRALTDAVKTGKEPSPLLGALAELGFPLVITTNYDQLFEEALKTAGREPEVVVYSPKLEKTPQYNEDPSADKPVVFKIHGDIDDADSIVITDENYIDFLLRMNNKDPYDPVPDALRYHLKVWATLFIGYSLLDYNLRVLFKTLRWKIDQPPLMYSIDFVPDPMIVDVWDNELHYVKFIAKDAWTMVPQLYERVLGKELVPSPQ